MFDMKGDWLLVLALKDRASKGPEVVAVEVKDAQQGDLAIWLQQRFNGYFSILVKHCSCLNIFPPHLIALYSLTDLKSKYHETAQVSLFMFFLQSSPEYE